MAEPAPAVARLPDLLAFRRALARGRSAAHAYVRLLGIAAFDTAAVLRLNERGLPYSALEHLQRNLDVSPRQLSRLVGISERTMARRREEGRLRPDESDRLLRASRLFGRTLELFEGDAPAARAWLSRPAPALGGAVPLAAAATEVGAREVEGLIGRLEHGVFA